MLLELATLPSPVTYIGRKPSLPDPITTCAYVRLKNISKCVAKYWTPLANIACTDELLVAQSITLQNSLEIAGSKQIDISYAVLALLCVWDAEYSYMSQIIDKNNLLKTRRLAFSGASKYDTDPLNIAEKQALHKIITYFERRHVAEEEKNKMSALFSSENDIGREEVEDEFTDSDEEIEYQ